MLRREQLNQDQRRLLRITGRMPLASVANLASTLGATEDRVRTMLADCEAAAGCHRSCGG